MPQPPADLVIREAGAADVPELLALVRELATYEKLADRVVATESELHEALFGGSGDAFAALALVGGETAGCAVWFHNFSTFVGRRGLYLEDLFVRPRFRGRGIGVAILRWLARRAVDEGCGRMEWAVLDWNTPAIDFYRALGAKGMDDWRIFRLDGKALEALASGES